MKKLENERKAELKSLEEKIKEEKAENMRKQTEMENRFREMENVRTYICNTLYKNDFSILYLANITNGLYGGYLSTNLGL
jgi:5-methylcytosine-specific restriction endonuclease McrBC GTP-binding regulatory subunit McrB